MLGRMVGRGILAQAEKGSCLSTPRAAARGQSGCTPMAATSLTARSTTRPSASAAASLSFNGHLRRACASLRCRVTSCATARSASGWPRVRSYPTASRWHPDRAAPSLAQRQAKLMPARLRWTAQLRSAHVLTAPWRAPSMRRTLSLHLLRRTLNQHLLLLLGEWTRRL